MARVPEGGTATDVLMDFDSQPVFAAATLHQRLGFVCEGKKDHAEALKYFKKAAELEDSVM